MDELVRRGNNEMIVVGNVEEKYILRVRAEGWI